MNAQFAFQLLQLANIHPASAEEVVRRAKVFADFIQGRDGPEPAAGVEIPQAQQAVPVDPGGKRVRRTKEQIAADNAGLAAAGPSLAPAAAQQAAPNTVEPPMRTVDYPILQNAFIELVEAGKRPAGVRILAQFGVTQAKDLLPTQYAECLDMVRAALSEASLA